MNDTSQSFVKFEKIDKSYDGEVLVVKKSGAVQQVTWVVKKITKGLDIPTI